LYVNVPTCAAAKPEPLTEMVAPGAAVAGMEICAVAARAVTAVDKARTAAAATKASRSVRDDPL
jgi:predicted homoserine dehydrogenase-like protein